MTEVFNIQKNVEKGQESKVTLNENILFNELHNLWLVNWKEHEQIKEAIATLKINLDNFNTWVDKNLLIWEYGISNSNDQAETYKWAKKTSNGIFQEALNSKVAELNSVINKMKSENYADTEELKQKIWNLLWVDSFIASVPKKMLLWDGQAETPDKIQLAGDAITKETEGKGFIETWKQYYGQNNIKEQMRKAWI